MNFLDKFLNFIIDNDTVFLSIFALLVSILAWHKNRAVYDIELWPLRGDTLKDVKKKLSSGKWTILTLQERGTLRTTAHWEMLLLGRIRKDGLIVWVSKATAKMRDKICKVYKEILNKVEVYVKSLRKSKGSISIFLLIFILLLTAASLFLLAYAPVGWEFKIAQTIQILLGSGAMLSAIFLISTYLSSLKPFLLLGITSAGNIFYENHSNNPFYDLKIYVSLKIGSRLFDVGKKRFPNPMYMSAKDPRHTSTIQDIFQQNWNQNFHTAVVNKKVSLHLSYEFNFLGRKERVEIQSYKWNHQRSEWEIN